MQTNNLAPIIFFVYKRPQHTKRALEALAENDLAKESTLYIYADGPKKDADKETLNAIKLTREILKEKQWCKKVNIIESSENKGLTYSIKEGISTIINKYGKAIIIEDDIITSPHYLQYMNDALNLYQDEDKVMSICALVPKTSGADKLPETYFLRFMSCWGWATWARAWNQYISDLDYLCEAVRKRSDFNHFNFDGSEDFYKLLEQTRNGSIDTWDLQWVATIFLKNGLCLFPKYSLTKNIGFDGTGEHCGNNSIYTLQHNNINLSKSVSVKRIKIKENRIGYNYLKRYYKYGEDSSLKTRFTFSKNKLKKTRFFQNPLFYKIYDILKK
ncbi:hypothetical protein JGH11_12795 [Dysgonomonas sp. Marseille-P4677]|uniref:hypothetical protein n=1 Tax=Dysgonomonas sp. Marseille-P4677 TaxID=2364790 RepID=UPI0019127B11|nr:hypothetical protein [Dysgonomonas sp. Marseille-P4677]MBK5721750.1 hypothetical protein [Dysgonomonas sp. Marseille-P4677]